MEEKPAEVEPGVVAHDEVQLENGTSIGGVEMLAVVVEGEGSPVIEELVEEGANGTTETFCVA